MQWGPGGAAAIRRRLIDGSQLGAYDHGVGSARSVYEAFRQGGMSVAIDPEQQALFEAATGERAAVMKQALRLAYTFEQELLCRGRDPGVMHWSDLIDRFQAGRAVGHEAVRILQSREIIRAKPGPNGGLIALAPATEHVLEVILQYAVHTRITPAAVADAREAAGFIRGALPAQHPGSTIAVLMTDVLDRLSEVPVLSAEPCRQRAARIARQIAIAMLRTQAGPADPGGLRLGHEEQLCERFGASRPVMRQAIRILQAQSLVETRRGRGRGLFLTTPQPGPVTRLIGLWLLGKGVVLRDVLEFERLLRTAMAVLAAKGRRCGPDHPVFELQHRGEARGGIGLLEVIEIEKNISWLTGNPLLDLFLRAMTVYKVGRGHYRQLDTRGLESYLGINRCFLTSLMARQETRLQRDCEEKNGCLREYDLRSAMPGVTAAN